MHDAEVRTANLLGAASLALSDLLLAGATAAAGTSSSGAAALVVLAGDPGLSVTELGRRIGLSQPAAARMADGLERQGLVRREPTGERRVAVHLTDTGGRAAHALLGARGEVLREPLSGLDQEEQIQLETLLSKLLTGLHRRPGDADRLCRLCDRTVCVSRGAVCPVGQADRDQRAARAREARAGEAEGDG